MPLTIVAPPPAAIETPPAAVETPPTAIEPTLETADKPVSVQGKTPVLGTLTCGGACRVGSKSATVKIGGKSSKLKVKLPATIAAGSSAPIKVVLPKSVMEQLGKGKTGTIRLTVTITDSTGRPVTQTIKVKIKQKSGGK